MKLYSIIFTAVFLLIASFASAVDNYTAIKLRMAQAPALKFYFQSIVESEIFESVDSLAGEAMICKDGAYRIDFPDDSYIYDGQYMYSYSLSSNQVVIEEPIDAATAGEQLTFITKIDSYYESHTILSEEKYRLYRLEDAPKSLPDSLILHINARFIDEITFFDLNMDLNRIAVDSVVYLDYCDTLVLKPDYPDSTETVKLY